MQANQKYFPLLDAQGKLTHHFLVVSNIHPQDPSAVIGGNERVVRPRLIDQAQEHGTIMPRHGDFDQCQVTGDRGHRTQVVDLQFPAGNINDLLKSMVLQDFNGGHIYAVSYDSPEPIARTLSSFAINLNNNPSFAQILQQARGERAEVALVATAANQPVPRTSDAARRDGIRSSSG